MIKTMISNDFNVAVIVYNIIVLQYCYLFVKGDKMGSISAFSNALVYH